MITLSEMAQLTTLYTQPHRKYHNINHINDCLTELENIPPYGCKIEGNDRKIVEKAIWYHDVVYNPYSKDNEQNSVDLIPDSGDVHFDLAVRDAVAATARHLQDQKHLSHTTQMMLDIDLSGFGKDRMTFAINGMNIRHEYYRTTIKDFLKGRLNFYNELVKRPTLYYTKHFYDLYHEKSRENIKWEMMLVEAALEHDNPTIWSNAIEAATDGYNP